MTTAGSLAMTVEQYERLRTRVFAALAIESDLAADLE
jgi:hypothetical protein